jgi:hypothetical protein
LSVGLTTTVRQACRPEPLCAHLRGTAFDLLMVVRSLLMARPDLVRVELTALGPHGTGPFKLVVHHAMGTIVEYFGDVTHALLRQGALEEVLI